VGVWQRHGEIQVEVFVAGDGLNYPKKGQTVVIHYTGYVRTRAETGAL
jgi:FKBP-type peptidyl-prolyl cis-trans isomerase